LFGSGWAGARSFFCNEASLGADSLSSRERKMVLGFISSQYLVIEGSGSDRSEHPAGGLLYLLLSRYILFIPGWGEDPRETIELPCLEQEGLREGRGKRKSPKIFLDKGLANSYNRIESFRRDCRKKSKNLP
jgi:hypothetical protein